MRTEARCIHYCHIHKYKRKNHVTYCTLTFGEFDVATPDVNAGDCDPVDPATGVLVFFALYSHQRVMNSHSFGIDDETDF